MIIVLGMFSGGVAYNRQIALRNAAREGARYGSVLPNSTTWAADVQQLVVDRSEGELELADICVAMLTGSTVVRSTSTSSPCYTDGSPGDSRKPRVQVHVNADANIEALVFSYPITLEAQSTARFEGSS